LSIDFTDQSQGNVTSWAWDFGDGTTSTIQNPSHTYQHAGTFTVTLTINGMQTATKTNYISTLPVLTVVLAGTGGGSVNSNPPGIHCETPPLTGPCATTYTLSDVVKLMAARNSDSLFTGWSDACTGGGDCSVTLSDSKKATATFTYVTQVRIPRNPVAEFSSIQNAYNTVLTGEEIQARAVSVIENLFFSNSIKVILKGGFDINYKNQGGYTIVQGKVTVGKGSLVVDRVIIR
jgi:PKD repeat protein